MKLEVSVSQRASARRECHQQRMIGVNVDATLRDDQTIWRYLDFPKFLDLLYRSSLFFPTLATLRELDFWEGRVPSAQQERMTEITTKLLGRSKLLASGSAHPNTFKSLLSTVYVSCWHQNDEESAAMWSQYGTTRGIAIASDIGRLRESLDSDLAFVISPVILYCACPLG